MDTVNGMPANDYYAMKNREYRAKHKNIVYYVVYIDGKQYAFTSKKIKETKIKGRDLDTNCTVITHF